MTTAAVSPPITDAAVTAKTRRVECVVLTEDEVSEFLALPIYAVRRSASTGSIAGFVRDGRNYVAPSEYIDKLRAVRAGKPASVVFAKLIELEDRAAFERERPMREAVAAADAKCARERKARQDAQDEANRKLREREAATLTRQAAVDPHVRLT